MRMSTLPQYRLCKKSNGEYVLQYHIQVIQYQGSDKGCIGAEWIDLETVKEGE